MTEQSRSAPVSWWKRHEPSRLESTFMLGPWLNCPKCHTSMEEKRHRGLDLHLCSRCRGWWVDREALARALSVSKSAIEPKEVKDLMTKLLGKATEIPCPSCSRSDLKVGLYRRIELEFCRKCSGVFLDAGELPRLLAESRKIKAPAGKAKSKPKTGGSVLEGLAEVIGYSLAELISEITSGLDDP